PGPVGRRVDRRAPRAAGGAGPGAGGEVTAGRPDTAGGTVTAGAAAPAGRHVSRADVASQEAPATGGGAAAPVRVDLVFEPGARRVRVPHGVSLFDAASWHGIAIDSTCGGHGTCKKCR